MKIGISTYCLCREYIAGRMDLPDMVDFVADRNGEQIEFSPGKWCDTSDRSLMERFISRAKERNIMLSSFTVAANFCQPDAASVAAELERMKGMVERAAFLGVPLMRSDAGNRQAALCTREQFEKDLPVVADCCGALADHAAKYGITLSVENHGYLFQNSERVQQLIKTVNRKNYRTTLDVGNFLCADEDPLIGTLNNISLAAQVHFKDFIRRTPSDFQPGGSWIRTRSGNLLRGTILGHGMMDIRALADIVKRSGYDGCISLEFEGPENCVTGTEIGIETLIRLFK
ncbi:MAG: sugar phosphate isomerase/epimerase [Lentisphaeria bacterium]|nr:sugar phosphate isomerase/epimerase [Lentisphaeria bacterium]